MELPIGGDSNLHHRDHPRALSALNAAEIAAYVATGEPLQCAGGFALEGHGGMVVERIEAAIPM